MMYTSHAGHSAIAEEASLNAWLAARGGKDDFAALFDLDGNLIAAKLINTKYGLSWGILATDDPSSRVVPGTSRSSTTARMRSRSVLADSGPDRPRATGPRHTTGGRVTFSPNG